MSLPEPKNNVFFWIWPEMAENGRKTRFFASGRLILVISSKQKKMIDRHLICKISQLLFSKVWPPMKLIFLLLLVGVQNLKPAELYQNVLQLFFSFSQFIFSLSRIYFWSERISIKHFVVFLNRLIHGSKEIICVQCTYTYVVRTYSPKKAYSAGKQRGSTGQKFVVGILTRAILIY